MTSGPDPISVMILDREYRVTCTPEERSSLLEAASILDNQMRQIRSSGRLMALERIAVLAALNLTDEKLKADKLGIERQQINDRVRLLADRVENALNS
ncbi:MAG: cell division protein ZapA [Proteobacteria bacterium]|nr:cell division protein ZapA [Pseudomonadota bacterium]